MESNGLRALPELRAEIAHSLERLIDARQGKAGSVKYWHNYVAALQDVELRIALGEDYNVVAVKAFRFDPRRTGHWRDQGWHEGYLFALGQRSGNA